MCAAAVAIASFFLIHPLLFGFAFLVGSVFGWRHPNIMGGAGPGARAYFIEGGANACVELLIVYMFTLGIVPLVVSVFSACVTYNIASRIQATATSKTDTDFVAQLSRRRRHILWFLGMVTVWLAICFILRSFGRVLPP